MNIREFSEYVEHVDHTADGLGSPRLQRTHNALEYPRSQGRMHRIKTPSCVWYFFPSNGLLDQGLAREVRPSHLHHPMQPHDRIPSKNLYIHKHVSKWPKERHTHVNHENAWKRRVEVIKLTMICERL